MDCTNFPFASEHSQFMRKNSPTFQGLNGGPKATTAAATRRSTASFMKPTAASAKKLSSTAAFAQDLAAAGTRGSPAVTRHEILSKRLVLGCVNSQPCGISQPMTSF